MDRFFCRRREDKLRRAASKRFVCVRKVDFMGNAKKGGEQGEKLDF